MPSDRCRKRCLRAALLVTLLSPCLVLAADNASDVDDNFYKCVPGLDSPGGEKNIPFLGWKD
jgi:hypothetical protein